MVEELVEKRTPIKKTKKKTTKHIPTAKELKESRKTIDFWKKSKKGPGLVSEKKKKKLPPGGISLGSSSTTTWKQTPTSKAVDDRAYKKKAKRWLASKNKSWADQPIRPSRVGSVAQVKRKTDAKGNTRSNFSGPGGMKPKHMDLYGNWLEKKEKLKKKK
jgi:hypothetical protein